jgi:hypothetical protein
MKSPPDPNFAQLELAAVRLGPLLDELTLVGGCAAGLLINDPAATQPRSTFDVDFIVEAATYVSLGAFNERLKARGFQPDATPGAPICRWRCGSSIVDVMPNDERVLGFSNRWYSSAVRHRVCRRLSNGFDLYHVDAPHFLATKLEAFESRGAGDVVVSHDIEDAIRVVDGRESVLDELDRAPTGVRSYVAASISRVLADRYFLEALPTYFGDLEEGSARARVTEDRLRKLIAAVPGP